MSKIILPGILTSYRPLRDRTFSVSFNTNELNDEQRTIIHSMHQNECVILVKSGNKIEPQEESILDELQVGKKPLSPSQRLRFVLSDLYEQKYKASPGYKDKEDFYQKKMKELIDHYSKKLNE